MTAPAPARSAISSTLLRLFAGRDEEYFFENLLMMLASGIDVAAALSALEQSVTTKAMRRIIRAMREDVEAGASLSDAISHQDLLPTQMIDLIGIGEQSGKLIENLTVVVIQLQKDKALKGKITSAMLYPMVVLSITVIVGVGIAWFLLPNLAQVFVQLHMKLPIFTVLLISFGNFLGRYGAIVVPGVIVTLVLLALIVSTVRPAKQFAQEVLFLIPGIRDVVREIELTRFGFVLGSLLSAGLPFPEALSLLAHSTTLYRYKRFYMALRQRVEEGHSFAKSIAEYPHGRALIPIPFQQLIIAAETSGKLADTLSKIGVLSEVKTDAAAKNLSVLLEPVLLVLVSLGVLWVAISVILPLYSLIGGINNGTP